MLLQRQCAVRPWMKVLQIGEAMRHHAGHNDLVSFAFCVELTFGHELQPRQDSAVL